MKGARNLELIIRPIRVGNIILSRKEHRQFSCFIGIKGCVLKERVHCHSEVKHFFFFANDVNFGFKKIFKNFQITQESLMIRK